MEFNLIKTGVKAMGLSPIQYYGAVTRMCGVIADSGITPR
jgi:hypothetical protein